VIGGAVCTCATRREKLQSYHSPSGSLSPAFPGNQRQPLPATQLAKSPVASAASQSVAGQQFRAA